MEIRFAVFITDPSGFSWLSRAFHSVANFLKSNPIARAIVQIAAAVILTATGVGAVIAAAGSAAIATGLSGGNLGQVLRSAAIAGLTALAFNAVGDFTGHQPMFGTAAYAENVAGHALVGCGAAVASGGSCQSGALSGAVGSALSPVTNELFPDARTDFGQRIGGTVIEATAGGLASVAGGGKFANGAVTAAFGYLFNDIALITTRDRYGPSFNLFGYTVDLSIEIGSHSAVLVDNSGEPVLYDPAGRAYLPKTRGSGDAFYSEEANLDSYVKAQEATGIRVSVVKIQTSAATDSEIANRIDGFESAFPCFCARSVSSALTGLGPFKNLGTYNRPGALEGAVKGLQ